MGFNPLDESHINVPCLLYNVYHLNLSINNIVRTVENNSVKVK